MVPILTFRDPVSIDNPSQCCVNRSWSAPRRPLSSLAESLSKKRPERKGAFQQGVRLAGAMARRGPWRKATHRTGHSTLSARRTSPGAIVSTLGREHGDAVDPTTRKGSKRSEHTACRQSLSVCVVGECSTDRRREQTASRRLHIYAASWVRDDPKRFPRSPPVLHRPRCSGSHERVCSIEFTHS